MPFKPTVPDVMSTPNVIPMADVMLVLLIIFMVVTPMLQKGQSVDLVPVDNPREMREADQDDAVILAITRDGFIYLGTEQIRDNEIANKVRDIVSARIDKTVYVKSDARAKYGRVVFVVDEVRSVGVDKLGLLTERAQQPARRPAPAGGQ